MRPSVPTLRRLVSPALLTLLLAASACGPQEEACEVGSRLARTELFFGLNRRTGPPVTESEWQDFVDTTVTPRFQEGLTMFDASGQYLPSNGQLVKEQSKVLVLLHDGSQARSADIDTLREAYKQRFDQESVMRVDSFSCVAF